MKTRLLLFLIFIINLAFGQINGHVRDSISKEPIAYVNIWVEDENIGTTSDENGAFKLLEISTDKILVFSSIGYQIKRIAVGKLNKIIELIPQVFDLNEFVVSQKKEKSEFIIGKFRKSDIILSYACDALPWIVARYFPYSPEYKQTPFLKSIKIRTSSRIADAKFNIRLYAINEKGEPGDYLFDKNIIGTAKKGRQLMEIDLSKYTIIFPEKGLFVAVEWLVIEDNKYEFIYTMEGSRKKYDGVRYEPRIGAIPCDTNENSWHFVKGKWYKHDRNRHPNGRNFNKFDNLAIELILTE